MSNSHMPDPITPSLYIGAARLAGQPEALRQIGITSVLKLYESPPDWPDGFTLCDMPFPDGEPIPPERMARHIRFITDEIAAGRVVLVVCGAGISRSGTAVLAYLVSTGMSLSDAIRLVKARHAIVGPLPPLLQSLIDYFKLPDTVMDAISWLLGDPSR